MSKKAGLFAKSAAETNSSLTLARLSITVSAMLTEKLTKFCSIIGTPIVSTSL
jgi:hypothetical protein